MHSLSSFLTYKSKPLCPEAPLLSSTYPCHLSKVDLLQEIIRTILHLDL